MKNFQGKETFLGNQLFSTDINSAVKCYFLNEDIENCISI